MQIIQRYGYTDCCPLLHLLAETQDSGVFSIPPDHLDPPQQIFFTPELEAGCEARAALPKVTAKHHKRVLQPSRISLLPAWLRHCSSLQLNSQLVRLLETYPTPHPFPFNSPSYDIKLHSLCQGLTPARQECQLPTHLLPRALQCSQIQICTF